MALFLDCPVAVLKRPSEGQLSAFSWSLLKNSLWSTSSYSSLLSCSKVFFLQGHNSPDEEGGFAHCYTFPPH